MRMKKPKSLKKNEEIVVFRKEHDPYMDIDKFLAIYTNEYVAGSSGELGTSCQSFYESHYGNGFVFDCTSHMSWDYYNKDTKPVTKEELEICRNALQEYWDSIPGDKVVVVPRRKMYFGKGC